MAVTPLNAQHKELGAKMTDFGGWEMPVEYTGIISEHQAVRERAGLFDVSHMGEFLVKGEDAGEFLDYLLTNKISDLASGKAVYSPMCYFDGGIVDDLLIYKLAKDKYFLVVNAANTKKDFDWITEQGQDFSGQVVIEDHSQNYALLALQGPRAEKILSQLTDYNLKKMSAFSCTEMEIASIEALVSRTGYTGEDGFEIYLKPDKSVELWQKLLTAGEAEGLKPAGLGARDTLRLEKCLCLYGNEISKDTNPLEAGLGWTVKFAKEDFIGKESLQEIKEAGLKRRLVGFIVKGRGIARHDYPILNEAEEEIGFVTSGSYSPSLEENIGLGYLKEGYWQPGQKINIKVRSRIIAAEVVEIPFI